MILQADQFTPEEIARNMRREAKAQALIDAAIACDPADRLPFLEAIIEGLSAGAPAFATDWDAMDWARRWAEIASRAERKAYALACFETLSPTDQAAFLSYVSGRAAA